jgi:hypothetical protein
MKKMGRPRSTSEQLRLRGAKTSVWQKRLHEENALNRPQIEQARHTAREAAVKQFVTLCDTVNSSFADRLDYLLYGYDSKSGQPIRELQILTKGLNGREFCFPPLHLLTVVRDAARAQVKKISSTEQDKEDKAMCEQFLQELEHPTPGQKYVWDVAETDLLWAAIDAFEPNDVRRGPMQMLSILIYASWRTLNGDYRYEENENPWPITPEDDLLIQRCSQVYRQHLESTGISN